MTNTRKIDIYLDGEYMCSTEQVRTCKEAIARVRQRAMVSNGVFPHQVPGLTVASAPRDKFYEIRSNSDIRAYYVKG